MCYKILSDRLLQLNCIICYEQSYVLRRRGRRCAAHPGQECGPCQLCGTSTSSYYSHPATWDKAISNRLYQVELSVVSDSCICRACERHIKRNISSENYKPRWVTNQEVIAKCILPECTVTSSTGYIVHSSVVTTLQIQSAFKVQVHSEGKLIPLRQTHYKYLHRFIHADTYKHAKCFTCSAVIKGSSRHCPDPVAIKQHFCQCGDVEFDITEKDILCTNCYNAHVEILRGSQDISLDHELRALLDNSSTIPVGHFTKYVNSALTEAIRKLGAILCNRVAILLLELYKFLLEEARKNATEMGIDISELQLKQEIPKRCFLGRLISFFGKHLAYACKQRCIGALLYRPGTDLLCCLSKALNVMQNANVSFLTTSKASTVEAEPGTSAPSIDNEVAQLDMICSKVNARLQKQIKQLVDQNASTPYDISKFDVEATIASLDPLLWRMVVNITRTARETKNDIPPENINHRRKLSCLYCLCVMFFSCNRCCSIPLHLLLTDLIDTQGGSSDLIQMLNKFGAVASSDTHRRYVQFKVHQKIASGFLSELNLNNFTIASVDNIDIMQRHSFVYCGDQGRSWHGTTIQVAQPLTGRAQLAIEESIEVLATTEPTNQVLENTLSIEAGRNSENSSESVKQSLKRKERPDIERSPAKTTSSPVCKKVTRRSRSLTEHRVNQPSQTRRVLFQATTSNTIAQLSFNHYSALKCNHTIEEFHLTEPEMTAIKELEKMAFLYIAQR